MFNSTEMTTYVQALNVHSNNMALPSESKLKATDWRRIVLLQETIIWPIAVILMKEDMDMAGMATKH